MSLDAFKIILRIFSKEADSWMYMRDGEWAKIKSAMWELYSESVSVGNMPSMLSYKLYTNYGFDEDNANGYGEILERYVLDEYWR